MSIRFFVVACALATSASTIASCASQDNHDAVFDVPVNSSDAGVDPGPGFGADGSSSANPGRSVRVTGKVYAPNGQLSVAGALVYLTDEPPPAIPQQVYCDKCVTLAEGTFGYSGADGSFDFTASVTTQKYIVVQKGQFRRVRPFVPSDGTNAVPKESTTFPSKTNDTTGDTTPKVVVLQSPEGSFDRIEDALTKLGITEFDLRSRDDSPTSILMNASELSRYQIVFIPCRGSAEETATDPVAKKNLQAFVSAGGKVYVTDYASEYVRQSFPGFIHWQDETAEIGSAAGAQYDAPAIVSDPGLRAWLDAEGHKTFELKDSWTKIASVSSRAGKDENGQPTTIKPKVWVEANTGGTSFPASVTFQQQCGRVLYSTYHTEPNESEGFLPQEKALFHVILEVGVCLGQLPGGGPR
jgi:hypothetical protein